MVIDELIVRNGTTNMAIDSYNNQMIDEIVLDGNSYHFAKQKDLVGETSVNADNAVNEPLVSLKVSGNTKQSLLPLEYQQAEYVESTGKQYIDTDLIPDDNTGVTIVFEVDNPSGAQYIFGNRKFTSSGTLEFGIGGSASNNYWGVWIAGTQYNSNFTRKANRRISIDITPLIDGIRTITFKDLTSNEETVITSNKTIYTNLNAFMFAYNGATINYGSVKILNCRLYSTKNVLRNYISCYENDNGDIGMYDLVNNVLYKNSGTGTFLKGEDVTTTPSIDMPHNIYNSGDNGIEIILNGNIIEIPQSVNASGIDVILRFAKYKNADYLLMEKGKVKYFAYSTEGDPTKPLSQQLENVPPIEYDLSHTEIGQSLLALATEKGTNVLEVKSEIPVSQTELSYWRQIIPNE